MQTHLLLVLRRRILQSDQQRSVQEVEYGDPEQHPFKPDRFYQLAAHSRTLTFNHSAVTISKSITRAGQKRVAREYVKLESRKHYGRMNTKICCLGDHKNATKANYVNDHNLYVYTWRHKITKLFQLQRLVIRLSV